MKYDSAIDLTKEHCILRIHWITPGHISWPCDVIKMAVCLHLYDLGRKTIVAPPKYQHNKHKGELVLVWERGVASYSTCLPLSRIPSQTHWPLSIICFCLCYFPLMSFVRVDKKSACNSMLLASMICFGSMCIRPILYQQLALVECPFMGTSSPYPHTTAWG